MVAVSSLEVPDETKLMSQTFRQANIGRDYNSPREKGGSWSEPGPRKGPFRVILSDGSEVTYSWYRFVDQPALQKLGWTEAQKKQLQSLVGNIHSNWPIWRDYMPPPSSGTLVELDPVLCVEPPKGLEAGFVPIVTSQGKIIR